MGADFIRKAAKSFSKSWDRRLVELSTATLFTHEPTCAARTARADMMESFHLQPGDIVTVQVIDKGLVAMRDLSVVARFTQPPPELLEAVHGSCGIAKGTVEQIHPLSRVAEISIC